MEAPSDAERYQAAVTEVARWLEGVAIEQDGGLAWPAQPTVADQVFPSLGWGGLGPILFFADMHRSTGDSRHLALAEGGARWLRSILATPDDNLPPGLFTGLGGFAVVFDELYRASGDESLRSDLEATFDLIRQRATETPDGAHWQEITEILWGTAGLGCLLLTTGRQYMGQEAVALATRAGDWLLTQMQPAPLGARWTLGEGPLRQRPNLRHVWFPNFAHGTAGIAFFLAQLGSLTGEKRFLDAALDGTRWVMSVCSTEGETCLAQHHDPDAFDYPAQIGPLREPDDSGPLYTLGWCHGPPGLACLFRELQVATGDDTWVDWVSRAANAVRQSGIPEQREPGFWDNVARCCGSAGVAELFLDLHGWRENPDDLVFARIVIDDLLDRAIVDDDGMRWSNIEFRKDPPELPAETSFLQGASGIGCTLLRVSRHLNGDRSVIRWPHAPNWSQTPERMTPPSTETKGNA